MLSLISTLQYHYSTRQFSICYSPHEHCLVTTSYYTTMLQIFYYCVRIRRYGYVFNELLPRNGRIYNFWFFSHYVAVYCFMSV
jgi:hypothetical protein